MRPFVAAFVASLVVEAILLSVPCAGMVVIY